MKKPTYIFLVVIVAIAALLFNNFNLSKAIEDAKSQTTKISPLPASPKGGGVNENEDENEDENKNENKNNNKNENALLMQKGGKGMLLQRNAYTLSYNKEARIPEWVAWCLTSSHTTGKFQRSGIKFAEDEDVPAPRATNMDYVNSGYDRGHMCPAGDNKWSQMAIVESFLYTNCCPQLHSLNSGDWNELEGKCRTWAKKFGKIYIVCGPLLMNKKHKTIGKNKVVVPEAFFKVVLCTEGTPKAIGFIMRNEERNKSLASYVNTVDDIERITGLDFFPSLPDNIEKKVEATADINDWK